MAGLLGNINFSSDRNEGGQGESGQGNVGGGQTTLSEDQFTKLLSAVSLNNESNQQSGNGQPSQSANQVHAQTGMTDSQLERLEKAVGKDAAIDIATALSTTSEHSQNSDALLLGEMDKRFEKFDKLFKDQSKALKEMGSVRQKDLAQVYGFDEVFTQENQEDLETMLNNMTANSDGLYDATAAFQKANEDGDVNTLNKFKNQFTDFMNYTYKDHKSVSGDNGASTTSDYKRSQSVADEIDNLNKQIETAMSGPNKDFDKVVELQEKVMQKAEELKQ